MGFTTCLFLHADLFILSLEVCDAQARKPPLSCAFPHHDTTGQFTTRDRPAGDVSRVREAIAFSQRCSLILLMMMMMLLLFLGALYSFLGTIHWLVSSASQSACSV